MSDDKQQIFAALRRNLKRGELDDAGRAELSKRLQQAPAGLIPARAQLEHRAQIELFIHMAQEASASVRRVEQMSDVPGVVAEFVLRENLPAELVIAPAAAIAGLPWAQQERLKIQQRNAQNGDRITVAPAFAGIAETGTLMLLSAADTPTTLNLLPDVHIVVLAAERIVGTYEDVWKLLRQQGPMPRTVNLITGPSRSADIEQTLQLGAHGPVQLHIVIADH